MEIRAIELDIELANKLSNLYEEVKTKKPEEVEGAYREIVERGNAAMTILKGESFDVSTPVTLYAFWANYDLLLKFSILSSMNEDRKEFLGRVEWWLSCSRVKSLENRIALIYLKSMILSKLLDNYFDARWCVSDIEKIIEEEGEVSVASTLELINIRGTIEMANKDWTKAVEIFNEIDKFPRKILWQSENSKGAADVFSNRGISLIHSTPCSVWSGIRDIATAGEYYQQQEKESPEEYIKKLKDELKKAIDKL